MAEGDSNGKVVVSGYVRESTKDALLEEAARRDEVLRAALGSAAPKVSVSSIVTEILENWRTANEAAASRKA